MKRFYDRTSKQLRELIPGELIRMYHPGNKRWLLGKCIKRVAPRSYVVEVNGVRYRRNRSFLRTTCEESPMYDSYVGILVYRTCQRLVHLVRPRV